jgi:hypothetical protein
MILVWTNHLYLRMECHTPCYLPIFELDAGGSPCLCQGIACEVSSSSSTGCDWFDASMASEDVLDEVWLNASIATDDISTGGVSMSSSGCRGSGRALHHLRDHLHARELVATPFSEGGTLLLVDITIESLLQASLVVGGLQEEEPQPQLLSISTTGLQEEPHAAACCPPPATISHPSPSVPSCPPPPATDLQATPSFILQ